MLLLIIIPVIVYRDKLVNFSWPYKNNEKCYRAITLHDTRPLLPEAKQGNFSLSTSVQTSFGGKTKMKKVNNSKYYPEPS